MEITAALLLVAPFFIHVYPPRPNPSFDYFLDNLRFIEDSLTSMEWREQEYPNGDFTLESVIHELGLRDQYLDHFESDLERAHLTDTPHVAYAFQDNSKNPIRIWIEDESYRIYSTGHDGFSKTGGLDPDDIWTGEPDKARAHIHKAYSDWWTENNRRNLWEQLFEQIKMLWRN